MTEGGRAPVRRESRTDFSVDPPLVSCHTFHASLSLTTWRTVMLPFVMFFLLFYFMWAMHQAST